MEICVTFRNHNDNLCSMFIEKFKSVEEAKAAMEIDARAFLDAHSFESKADAYCGYKRRASMRWMDTKKTDYLRAIGKDGETCYWQYFAM